MISHPLTALFLVPLIKLVILLQCQREQREETQQLMVLIMSSLMIRLSSLSVLTTLVIHIGVYTSDIGYNGIHLLHDDLFYILTLITR